MLRRATLLLVTLGVLPLPATAADEIILRTEAKPAEAWVGQRVVVQVDVLGAEGWAQIKRFGDVELPGAYLIRTASQGNRLQESIDGRPYIGSRYEFSVYPQKAAAIDIPPLPVEVTVSTLGLNATETVQQLQAPPLTIDARWPPGAEGAAGLISSSLVTARQQWSRELDDPRVGDALQRTILFQADDVSGMAFAPLQHAELPGVGSYPAEPRVEDRFDRGDLAGERTEAVTYVFERAGRVRTPPVELTWWNLSSNTLETLTLPGREFEVAPGPADAGASTVHDLQADDLWLPATLLILALAILGRSRDFLSKHWTALRRRQLNSEVRYFERALSSVHSGNARHALRDIMHWLDRIHEGRAPAQLGGFVSRYADDKGQADIERLLQAAATNSQLEAPAQLGSALRRMRKGWRVAQARPKSPGEELPAMNGSQ